MAARYLRMTGPRDPTSRKRLLLAREGQDAVGAARQWHLCGGPLAVSRSRHVAQSRSFAPICQDHAKDVQLSNEQSTTGPTLDAAQLEVELACVRRQLEIAQRTFDCLELDIANGTVRDTLLRYIRDQRTLIAQAGKP
jgi:hypothetical protein